MLTRPPALYRLLTLVALLFAAVIHVIRGTVVRSSLWLLRTGVYPCFECFGNWREELKGESFFFSDMIAFRWISGEKSRFESNSI